MGSERTAGDRLDAIFGHLEEYLLNPSAASTFLNRTSTYNRGAARVIIEGLINGLTPPEFKAKVEGALRFKEGWKTAPDVVFEVAEAAAQAWRTVEEFQRSGAARGKSSSGASVAGATVRKAASSSPSKRRSGGALTCWTCGGAGHRSADCQSSSKSGTGKGSGPREAGQQSARSQGRPQQRRDAGSPANGTPAARGGPSPKPAAARGTPVAARTAAPVGATAPESGATPGVVPPSPLPNGGGGRRLQWR